MATNTMTVPRPIPPETARKGLFKITGMDVTFAKGTPKRDQAAALAHLNDLIEWWNTPYLDWVPNNQSKRVEK